MFRKLKNAGRPIAESGITEFRRSGHRIHLRIENSGRGMLTVDASRIIHLNQVAADMSWMILSETPAGEMLSRIRDRYNVSRKKVEEDLAEFRALLEKILSTGAAEPISFHNMEVTEPFQTDVKAPYRMDLALTYRCDLNCGHCYNQERKPKELSTEEWKRVIGRIWDIGVPHLIFTGGEATLRQDLPELIGFAEETGMVTGLLTNGVRLSNEAYVRELIDAGLDHVQITLESFDESVHNSMTGADSFKSTVSAIENCVKTGLHTITNTTLTRENARGMPRTVRFVHGLGLNAVAANAVIQSGRALEGDYSLPLIELESVILETNEVLEELGMRFIWYSPTRYCAFNPLEFGLGEKRCTAGEYNLCVEPDGRVLPCQSWYESAGNILRDPWKEIWEHPLLVSARERDWADDQCRECIHFTLCGGGCPLEKRAEGRPCLDSV